jgi:hypothetical protein
VESVSGLGDRCGPIDVVKGWWGENMIHIPWGEGSGRIESMHARIVKMVFCLNFVKVVRIVHRPRQKLKAVVADSEIRRRDGRLPLMLLIVWEDPREVLDRKVRI